MHTDQKKLPNSALVAEFAAKMLGTAHQCLSFIFILSLITVALISIAPMSASAEASGPAPTPELAPASPELVARLRKLETELRCLVCQNQTLADSPAGLAGDLRREIRLLAESGKSDGEIKLHLQARYGDFVLYRPLVETRTYLLWFGPFVLLFGGGALLWWLARARRIAGGRGDVVQKLSDEESKRASALLD